MNLNCFLKSIHMFSSRREELAQYQQMHDVVEYNLMEHNF